MDRVVKIPQPGLPGTVLKIRPINMRFLISDGMFGDNVDDVEKECLYQAKRKIASRCGVGNEDLYVARQEVVRRQYFGAEAIVVTLWIKDPIWAADLVEKDMSEGRGP